MDLSTKYLGLSLKHPLMLGASPMVRDLDQVKRAVDAGAAAVVMQSLFEEQLLLEESSQRAYVQNFENASAEAMSFVPKSSEFLFSPEEYLEQLRKLKAAIDVPVIGSLNGVTSSGWLDYAKSIEQAGADALELNIYALPTGLDESAMSVEQRTVDMVSRIKKTVKIPVAIKLSPFYTSPVNLAAQLEAKGADGLVIFNRFYQPDIDVEALEVNDSLELSTNAELLLRLRWLAVLSTKVKVSLAVTGGVHSGLDALKAVMAGATAVQAVSAVLKQGPFWFTRVRDELSSWLVKHEYESLAQARGSMNLSHCPDPGVYERGNYMRVLRSWTRANLGW